MLRLLPAVEVAVIMEQGRGRLVCGVPRSGGAGSWEPNLGSWRETEGGGITWESRHQDPAACSTAPLNFTQHLNAKVRRISRQ